MEELGRWKDEDDDDTYVPESTTLLSSIICATANRINLPRITTFDRHIWMCNEIEQLQVQFYIHIRGSPSPLLRLTHLTPSHGPARAPPPLGLYILIWLRRTDQNITQRPAFLNTDPKLVNGRSQPEYNLTSPSQTTPVPLYWYNTYKSASTYMYKLKLYRMVQSPLNCWGNPVYLRFIILLTWTNLSQMSSTISRKHDILTPFVVKPEGVTQQCTIFDFFWLNQ